MPHPKTVTVKYMLAGRLNVFGRNLLWPNVIAFGEGRAHTEESLVHFLPRSEEIGHLQGSMAIDKV